MRNYSIILLSLLLFLSLPGQAQDFLQARGLGTETDSLPVAIDHDSEGNVYIIGAYTGTLDLGNGTTPLTGGNTVDYYLAKFNSGTEALWVQPVFSSFAGLQLTSLRVDEINDRLLVGGTFQNEVVLGNTGAFLPAILQDLNEGFVAAFNLSDGGIIQALNVLYGGFSGQVDEIEVNGLGQFFIAGRYVANTVIGSTNINDIINTQTLVFGSNGGSGDRVDATIAGFDGDGSLLWSSYTQNADQFSYKPSISYYDGEIADFVYLGGSFQSSVTLVDANGNTAILSGAGFEDIYISRFETATGTGDLGFSDGDANSEVLYDLETDLNGNIYIGGSLNGPSRFSGINLDYAGGDFDAFMVKYDLGANAIWAQSAGGSGSEIATRVAIDADQQPYFAGLFNSNTVSFTPANTGEDLLSLNGVEDIFLTRMDTTSGSFTWTSSINGNNQTNVFGLSFSGNTGYLIGGYNGAINFPDGTDLSTTGVDGFLASFDNGSTPDLQLSLATVDPTLVRPGTEVSISFNLRNNSLGNTPEFQLGLYLSTDQNFDLSDQLLEEITIDPLDPGETLSPSTPLFIPSQISAGTYTLFAVADAAETISEIDRSNNLDRESITVEEDYSLLIGTDLDLRSVDSRAVAIGDIDNDGDDDLAIASFGQPNSIYRNDGGTLIDITPAAMANLMEETRGIAFGDYDQDRNIDLFVVNNGTNRIYRGDGLGGFTEIVGINTDTDTDPSSSVNWVDYDNDNYLDLFVTNSDGTANRLYHNQSTTGFAPVSNELTTDLESSNGAAWADIDLDGDMDVFIANDGTNRLWLNNGDGSFTELVDLTINGSTHNSTGASFGDLNGDGLPELYVTNTNDTPNELYFNAGSGLFIASDNNLTASALSSTSSVMLDYNNDGFLDVYVTNTNGADNALFQNQGSGNFERIAEGAIGNDASNSSAVASFDFDQDGFLDLLVPQLDGPEDLYRNNGNEVNNWLQVKLIGLVSNSQAIGSRVKITINGDERFGEVISQTGSGGQSATTVHFGVGTETRIDELIIRWSSGEVRQLSNLDVNQTIAVTEPDGIPIYAGRVLILDDGLTAAQVNSSITSAGFTTNIQQYNLFDNNSFGLDDFDAVVLPFGALLSPEMPESGQAALVDYVNNGGGLITMARLPEAIAGGSYTTLAPLVQRDYSSTTFSSETITITDTSHPIMVGVSSSFVITHQFNVGSASNGGTSIASGSNSSAAVVVGSFGRGKLVTLSTAGGGGTGTPFASPDMELILLNSLAWLADKDFADLQVGTSYDVSLDNQSSIDGDIMITNNGTGSASYNFTSLLNDNLALQTDGSTQSMSISSHEWSGSSGFTVEGWFLADGTKTGVQRLFNTLGSDGGWLIRLNNESYPARIQALLGESDGSFEIYQTNDLIFADQWYHVAVSFDLINEVINIYLDGQKVLEQNTAGSLLFSESATAPLIISASGDIGLAGLIDEIRIWSTPLDSLGVNQDRFSRLDGSEANLEGYWNFDGSSGSTVPNLSPITGLDGSLLGAPFISASDRNIFPNWLQISQTTGTIEPQVNGTIPYTVDANGLEPGIYDFSFPALFSDPFLPEIGISFNIEVFDSNAPATPSDFNGFVIDEGVVRLTWLNNLRNVEGYSLERSTTPGDGFTPLAQLSPDAAQYDDSTVLDNTRYYYRLIPFNTAFGEGDPTDEFEVQVLGDPIVTVSPANFTIDSTITLTFDARNAYLPNVLVGASEVYYYSSIVTDNSTELPMWNNDFTVGNFGVDDGIGEMTALGDEQWSITIDPVSYYSIPDSETAFFLAMVFSNGDGSLQGKGPAGEDGLGNIFIEIPPYRIEAPGEVQAVAESSSIVLNWTDNTTLEEDFLIERSITDNSNFIKYDSVGVNIISYEDADVSLGETYFYRITARNTFRSSDPSAEVNALVLEYCASEASSNADTKIDTVQFSDLEGGSDPVVCETYTDNTSQVAQVVAGQETTLRVVTGTCGVDADHHVKAWIDWNQDGTFSDDTELVLSSNTTLTGPAEISAPVTVPNSTIAGQTYRMRVVTQQTDDPATVTACGTYGNGETEDYVVQVGVAPDYAIRDFNISPNPAVITVDDLNITAFVDNNGASSGAEVFYEIRLSDDALFDDSDQVLVSQVNLGQINAGNSVSINTSRNTSAANLPIDGFAIMRITNSLDLPDGTIADNESTVAIALTDLAPDLSLLTFNATETTFDLDQDNGLSFTISNDGGAYTGTALAFDLYLSADETIDAGDFFIQTETPAEVGRFSTEALTSTINIPSTSISPGDYFLLGELDPDNLIAEQREDNNLGSIAVTLTVDLDDDEPVLTFVERPTSFNPSTANSVTVSVTITDDTEVSSVNFYRRALSDDDAFTAEALSLLGNGQTYEATISSTLFDELGVEFYFEASDAAGNTAYSSPSATNGSLMPVPAAIYTSYSENQLALSGIRTGTTVSDYQLIAFPFTGNPSVSNLFEELGATDRTAWRMFSYNGNTNSELSANSNVRAGDGYWLITQTVSNLSIGGANAVQASADDPFTLSLRSGWNLIGNPYNFNISWTDVLSTNVADGTITAGDVGSLRLFNGASGFTAEGASTVLARYRGAFVFSNVSASLSIPVSARTNASGRLGSGTTAPISSHDIDAEQWLLALSLHSGERSTQYNAIGMHPTASPGRDQYDDFTLPWPGLKHELNFRQAAAPGFSFSRDVVPTASTHTWELEVDSEMPDEYLRISWDAGVLAGARQGLFLYDLEADVLLDMSQTDQYSFRNRASQHMRIIYGDAASIRAEFLPRLLGIKSVYPNPGSAALTVAYSLPDQGRDYAVQLWVTDLQGRRVVFWSAGAQQAGFYEYTWSGLNTQQQAVAPGLYLLHLQVTDAQGSQRFVQKLIRQ